MQGRVRTLQTTVARLSASKLVSGILSPTCPACPRSSSVLRVSTPGRPRLVHTGPLSWPVLRCRPRPWTERSLSTECEPVPAPSLPYRLGQPHPSTHPHLLRTGEVTPGITKEAYAARRASLLEQMAPGAVALIPSAPMLYMSHDIPYPFRQDTDFLYLTGFLEPDAFLVLRKGGDPGGSLSGDRFFMFVRPRDPDREIWDGPRTGVDAAVSEFGADEAFEFDTLRDTLPTLLADASSVMYRYSDHDNLNAMVSDAVDAADKGGVLTSIGGQLQRMRLYKSDEELALLERAGDVIGQAFRMSMASTRPDLKEHVLSALVEFECRRQGAQRLSFPPVVAGGERANTLHYIANDDVLRDGTLVLMDAGAECDGYSSDVTRTWPVNGRFSDPQREVYEMVLAVNKACIEIVQERVASRVPLSLDQLHGLSIRLMCDGLARLGIGHSSAVDLITSRRYGRFYMHHVSHWLGMDIHDTPSVPRTLPLQPRMVFTIEPGVYLPHDPDVPPAYRGIGVRIEDDVAILADGRVHVLTAAAPKEVDDICALMTATRSNP